MVYKVWEDGRIGFNMWVGEFFYFLRDVYSLGSFVIIESLVLSCSYGYSFEVSFSSVCL